MGYDLVTWSPRIGSSGDDKYDVPGATRISGSLDTSVEFTKNVAGTTGSYWNQVIALANLRYSQFLALAGASASPFPYLSADEKITAERVVSLYALINSIRGLEGFASYTFPSADVAANKKIPGYLLAHARKALRISGLQTITRTHSLFRSWYQYDANNPYGTVNSSTITTSNLGGVVGVFVGGRQAFQAIEFPTVYFWRQRGFMKFPIFSFVDASQIVSAALIIKAVRADVGWSRGYALLASNRLPPNPSGGGVSTPAPGDFGSGSIVGSIQSTVQTSMPISAAEFVSTNCFMGFSYLVENDLLGVSPTPLDQAPWIFPASGGGGLDNPTNTLQINWGS